MVVHVYIRYSTLPYVVLLFKVIWWKIYRGHKSAGLRPMRTIFFFSFSSTWLEMRSWRYRAGPTYTRYIPLVGVFLSPSGTWRAPSGVRQSSGGGSAAIGRSPPDINIFPGAWPRSSGDLRAIIVRSWFDLNLIRNPSRCWRRVNFKWDFIVVRRPPLQEAPMFVRVRSSAGRRPDEWKNTSPIIERNIMSEQETAVE